MDVVVVVDGDGDHHHHHHNNNTDNGHVDNEDQDEIWIFMVKVLTPHDTDGNDDDGGGDNNGNEAGNGHGQENGGENTAHKNKRQRVRCSTSTSTSKGIVVINNNNNDDVDVDNDDMVVDKATATTTTMPATESRQQPRTDIYYSRDPINAVRRFNGLDILSDIDLIAMGVQQRESATASATLAQAVSWGTAGSDSTLAFSSSSSSSSSTLVTAPATNVSKPRVTRHMSRLDEALNNSNGDGLASVGALADALAQQIDNKRLPTSLNNTSLISCNGTTRLVKSSTTTTTTTTITTTDTSTPVPVPPKRPPKLSSLLPRLEDVLYAAYTHKGSVRRMSRTHNYHHRLCMVLGPVSNDIAARALTLLWMKPSRGIMPRAVWGEAIAKCFELELYGDYEAIVDQVAEPLPPPPPLSSSSSTALQTRRYTEKHNKADKSKSKSKTDGKNKRTHKEMALTIKKP